MRFGTEPARYMGVAVAVLSLLVTQGVLQAADAEAWLRVIAAVFVAVLPVGANEIVRAKVVPVDEEQTTYVATPAKSRRRETLGR